jgi:3-hydroxyacyl-CoA dehydrogenase/enoyl-CoA hydratase/3-hydroxybutyryl-CoA epimerase
VHDAANALGMTHRWDDAGILSVVFDRPGENVNLLTPEILDELNRLLDRARGHPDLRGMLLTSAKPGMFIAGMDVDRIASVTDPQVGVEAARFGQSVFQKIAELKQPSVCVIGGTCLGGGTELALACTLRIASDGGEVKIGLPEVRLGIVPGFGGTQRLPRLVGLTAALDLILTGRTLDARRAKKIGLVDRVVPHAYLERESLELLKRAIGDGGPAAAAGWRRKRSWASRAMETVGPVRRFVLRQVRKRTAAKADPRHYPAPFKAIEAVDAAFARPLRAGLDLEARIVGELVPIPTTKNLIWLFKSHTALKSQRAGLLAVPRRVKRLAVLGAGIMGGGIAQLAAHHDIPVRLKDVRYEAILPALQTARKLWERQLRRRRITRRELTQKMAFIAPTLDDSGMRQVDLVVEAVVEDLDVKQKVLAALERRLDERAVFASNTSSLPISDIAARALHPERVVGMHFFNPVHRMPLVEVIAGRRSSPEAVATVQALTIKLGKVPVIVKDGPGFLVNRILTFYLNEAARLLAEGVRIEAADRAMKGFGMPMGPFELLDEVGLDTAKHVGEVLKAGLGKRAGGESSLLDALVSDGRLGKKNERGLYHYRDGRRTKPDGDVYGLIGTPAARELPPETLQERMVLAMVNEAARCLEEAVVRQARDVDMAMVMGTGFPPFRGGVLRHADAVGIPIVVDRLSRLADAQGERFRPCAALEDMVREQRRFYPEG